MQRLSASSILCNGIYRVPEDHQRFRNERPRTDSRLQSAWHLLLPVPSSIRNRGRLLLDIGARRDDAFQR
jgi:hypothetical protein